MYVDIEKKPSSNGGKIGFFFPFSLRAIIFRGPENTFLKHSLKFRVEEGPFSWFQSRFCPRSVIGGLQRVAETRLLVLSA